MGNYESYLNAILQSGATIHRPYPADNPIYRVSLGVILDIVTVGTLFVCPLLESRRRNGRTVAQNK